MTPGDAPAQVGDQREESESKVFWKASFNVKTTSGIAVVAWRAIGT
jgi:hypothetical protein